jgi:nucleoside-diphosphate-sugar epimerase
VRALSAADRPVRVLVRSEEAAARVLAVSAREGGVDFAFGDLSDARSLREAARGCGLVYHLAGTYRGSPEELQAMHVDGTARLLEALEPDARLVLLSSTSVYGWDQVWPADHETPPQPSSAYGRAKLAAEDLVRARPTGETVIARSTIVYGPGDADGMLARVARLLSRRVRWFPGNGQNRVHLVHIDDLVAALLLLGDRGDGVFVLGGPEAAPIRRILELLADGAGLPRPLFGVPSGPVRGVARAVEEVWTRAGRSGEPPLNRHSLDVATRDRAYSTARAEAELGWKPQVALEIGVPAVGAWLADVVLRKGKGEVPKAAKEKVARTVPGFEAGHDPDAPAAGGFDWRGYFVDPDEGLGTVYERFALDKVLESAIAATGATSVLHAPLFGMMGIPGLDAVFLARRGIRVGLLDVDGERLEAVHKQWRDLGLDPEVHLVDGLDPAGWPDTLPLRYDLAFSFAALWWFEDPWAVQAALARWADKGVLTCVPNRNVFMRMRARLWHKDLFDRLNENALDAKAATRAAAESGLRAVDTGLFDIPPFPDTSVPLAKLLRARKGKAAPEGEEEQAWAWSILPFLTGDDPGMEDRVARLSRWERFLPGVIQPALAHHRYVLFTPEAPPDSAVAAGAATHTQ